ncbi:MAG: hypothetical protein A2Z34_04400 [Planctomycetes bacterium RBG_16_59_8]|nr:MAG: hypothetical protein A2Z34_04400 [Planctomycetes bacterium RBG_16_59_8]
MVITDLDGCLLDSRTYAWESHRETLDELKRRGIPVVLCTSKTRAETEALRREVGHEAPFIVESGGAVIFADRTLTLGVPYARVLEGFRRLKQCVGARGFSDMSVEEIAVECGMTLENARLAKRREYDEPFLCDKDPALFAEDVGLRCSRGGRFWHLHGATDKGFAIRALLTEIGPRRTMGIGDSMLDLPLLDACDLRVAIARPDGTHDPELAKYIHGLRYYPNWSSAVRSFLPSLSA